MAVTQLQLSIEPNMWSLDRTTIRVGKAGLAQARAVLETCQSIEDEQARIKAANTPHHVSAAHVLAA